MTTSRHDLYVGCDVVCIDDKVPLVGKGTVKDAYITEGAAYRVRWVGWSHLYQIGDYLGVKLEGIDSKFGEVWGEPDAPYNARRFRPLVNDPLAWARKIAADPHNPPPGAPDDGGTVKEKELEEV